MFESRVMFLSLYFIVMFLAYTVIKDLHINILWEEVVLPVKQDNGIIWYCAVFDTWGNAIEYSKKHNDCKIVPVKETE